MISAKQPISLLIIAILVGALVGAESNISLGTAAGVAMGFLLTGLVVINETLKTLVDRLPTKK